MNQMSEKLPIGINLGITNSTVAAWWNNRCELVENHEGTRINPSYVYYLENEQRIGRMTCGKSSVDTKHVLFDAKRLLATNVDNKNITVLKNSWPFTVSNKLGDPSRKTYYKVSDNVYVSPEDVSSCILKSLLEDVCRRFDKKPEEIEAVITVPAYFNISQKRATFAAAEKAGLTVIQLLSEPVAGAICCQHEMNFKDGEIILTFDLGAGTFDVTIMEITEKLFRVIAFGGDSHLGGRDFDMVIVEEMENRLEKQLGKEAVENLDPQRKFKMIDLARKAKEALSFAEKKCLNLSDIHHDATEEYITREEFEKKSEELKDKIRKSCLETIEDAKLNCDQINHVVLIGGSSKICLIKNIMAEIFGKDKKLSKTVSADESIAKGVAMYAAKFLNASDDPKIQNLGIQNVLSFSIGAKTPVIIGIHFRHDSYEIAIYSYQYDKVEMRTGESSNFEEIISNLKDEFGDELEQIFALPHEDVLTGSDITERSNVHILSEKDLDFTHYLSTKLAPKTQIFEFDCKWDSAVKCVLYEVITLDNKRFEAKPIKCLKTRFDAKDFDEMLIYVFDLKTNGTHAICYKSDTEKNIFFEKIMQRSEHFCSFTMMETKELKNINKIIIFGRFLLNNKNIQSLVKLEPSVEQYFGKLRLRQSDFEVKNPESYTVPRPIKDYESQTNLMGIDLGSSRCVVCISRNRNSELVKIDKEYPMRTFICFDEKKPIIGNVALRKLNDKPRSVLFDFKQVLKQGPMQEGWTNNFEDSWPFGICESAKNKSFLVYSEGILKKHSSTEIYKILLEKLKEEASEYQSDLNAGKDVDQAVVTVPRLFNYDMIINIRKAADLAKIKIIDIIDESHADLLYVLSKYVISRGESVLIIDIGGGTGFIQKFMIRSHFGRKKITQVFSAAFDFHGREIDKMLMKKLRELLSQEYNVKMNDVEEYKMFAKIEKLKEDLSFQEIAHLDLPSKIGGINNPLEMKRTWFEKEVVEPLLLRARVEESVTGSMMKGNLMLKSSKVFLVGGTCRIPYVQNYFKSIFGDNEVIVPNNLQEITAQGALIRGLQVLNKETQVVLCDKANNVFGFLTE